MMRADTEKYDGETGNSSSQEYIYYLQDKSKLRPDLTSPVQGL